MEEHIYAGGIFLIAEGLFTPKGSLGSSLASIF